MLHTKLGFLDFQGRLARVSPWHQTELMLELLVRVAFESQYYRNELQLIVTQLRQDLFTDMESLPLELRKALEKSYVEGYVSKQVPLHCLQRVLLELNESLRSDIKVMEQHSTAKAQAYEQRLAAQTAEIEELRKLLIAAQLAEKAAQVPIEKLTCQLSEVTEKLREAEDTAVQLRQDRAVLQQQLRLRSEQLNDAQLIEEKLKSQVEELRREVKLCIAHADKKKQQCRSLEAHCQQLVVQTRAAAHRVEIMEEQLAQAEREFVALRDRAAVAFDELTPRPDWKAAGMSDSHKSSKACLQDLVETLHRKSKQKLRHS